VTGDLVHLKIKDEDRVWFENRWMLTSWCDESLTTWCGQIFWLSIAGAGCGLTGGAGEEPVRKIISSEASRCGEDK
jgi:hypothetical protein